MTPFSFFNSAWEIAATTAKIVTACTAVVGLNAYYQRCPIERTTDSDGNHVLSPMRPGC